MITDSALACGAHSPNAEWSVGREDFNVQPLPFEQFDYTSVFGRCCENVIGTLCA